MCNSISCNDVRWIYRYKLQKNVLVTERPPFYGEEVLRVEWLIYTGLTVKRNWIWLKKYFTGYLKLDIGSIS